MSEEETRNKLIQQARDASLEKRDTLTKKEHDDIKAGLFELKKIFPYLKHINGRHCEVFGYEFFLGGPDSKGHYYLTKVGGDNFDIYQGGFNLTYIYTEEDMSYLLFLWDERFKTALEGLENYLRCPKHYAKPYRYNELMRIRNKDKPTSPPNQTIPGGGCLLFIGFIIAGIFGVSMM